MIRSAFFAVLATFALTLPRVAFANGDDVPQEEIEMDGETQMNGDATAPEQDEVELGVQPEAEAAQPEATVEVEEPLPPPAAETREDRADLGAAFAAGAGVSDFSRSAARDFLNTGAAWDVRGVFGTRSLLGIEAAYIGSANELETPGDSNTLFGNGAEVSGRLNVLRNGMDNRRAGVQPYLLGGVAWRHYSVSGDLETADVDDSDNTFEVPVGAGVAYYFDEGIMLDGRFAYRFAFEDDLIQPVGEDNAGLDNWNATARLGVEF